MLLSIYFEYELNMMPIHVAPLSFWNYMNWIHPWMTFLQTRYLALKMMLDANTEMLFGHILHEF